MIPKVIHYCWFGYNPLPDEAKKYIDSWKKYCPGYEVRQWDESNFNVNCCQYVKDAYEAKKWAFVSDYARFWILYKYGGLYFDTDVEMIKPIDDIVAKGSFMGMEQIGIVAPGLGLAANPGLNLYKEILNEYEKSSFYKFPGVQEDENVVGKVTKILKQHGFNVDTNEVQQVCGIMIYTPEYFAPLNYKTRELEITENTRTIHHYAATWINPMEIRINELEIVCSKCNSKRIRYEIRLKINLLKVCNRIKELGFIGFIQYAVWMVRRKMK